MTRRRLFVALLGLIVVSTAWTAAPSSAEARSRRNSSYRWGGGTSRYGSYPPRRTKGLKQLGPVPALGGVRSLPYWGGER